MKKNEGLVHNHVLGRKVKIVQHCNSDAFCCSEIFLRLDSDFHQISILTYKEERFNQLQVTVSQQSLRTRSQAAREGSSAHPERLGGGRTADGIPPCTSLQREILKGIQHRSLQKGMSAPQLVTQLLILRWEPPPHSSPTGSTSFSSLTGFQECSLQPINK